MELDGVTLTSDDSATACVTLEETVVPGSYRPSSLFNAPLDEPAPDAPYGTNLSFFAPPSPGGIAARPAQVVFSPELSVTAQQRT